MGCVSLALVGFSDHTFFFMSANNHTLLHSKLIYFSKGYSACKKAIYRNYGHYPCGTRFEKLAAVYIYKQARGGNQDFGLDIFLSLEAYSYEVES